MRSGGTEVHIEEADYSSTELDQEARRIAATPPEEVGGIQVTGVGPLSDYSGLKVSISDEGQIAEAGNNLRSTVPLVFDVMPENKESSLAMG